MRFDRRKRREFITLAGRSGRLIGFLALPRSRTIGEGCSRWFLGARFCPQVMRRVWPRWRRAARPGMDRGKKPHHRVSVGGGANRRALPRDLIVLSLSARTCAPAFGKNDPNRRPSPSPLCAPTNCSAPIRDAGYRGRALRRARNRTAYPSANVAMAEASRSPP
jgi:hypothetical protein